MDNGWLLKLFTLQDNWYYYSSFKKYNYNCVVFLNLDNAEKEEEKKQGVISDSVLLND